MPQSRRRFRRFHLLAAALAVLFAGVSIARAAADVPDAPDTPKYAEAVLHNQPVAYWRLNQTKDGSVLGSTDGKPSDTLRGKIHGQVAIKPGPRPGPHHTEFVEFTSTNSAADFAGKDGYIVVADPGEKSALDFGKGDSITLEAWVNPRAIKKGQYVYIIGKGRTGNKGMAADNQNYALRLASGGGTMQPSFVFRDADNRKGKEEDWHRWTATEGFAVDGDWHHVAVSYTFGSGKSIKGYIDGYEVKGQWDMGGQTDEAPYVDNDELWIGSSMHGNASSTFNGLIDEVAIYRRAIKGDEIISHYNYVVPAPVVKAEAVPEGVVRVEVVESVPDRAWNIRRGKVTDTYTAQAFGFPALPRKYNDKGLITDRTGPFLVRASAMIELPAGEQKLLLRSFNGARLSIDNVVVGMNRFIKPGGDAHQAVPDMPAAELAGIRPLAVGHAEQVFTVTGTPGSKQLVVLEAQVGGANLRQEVGELSISLLGADGMYHLLAARPGLDVPLTDAGWETYRDQQTAVIADLNTRNRNARSAEEKKYWDFRHDLARSAAPGSVKPPQLKSIQGVSNDVDRYINARLENEKVTPAALTTDEAFIRRVYIDVVGVSPSPKEIARFYADVPEVRRAKVIDRLLADPRWADNWVSYWQDVLAENPGMLKPQLNNTGPFRWWIHEALLDNRPADRFATELIMMEGSKYYGGPAGFEMATDNDVPMAEKAHTVTEAFLAVEMKCARCHDAPFHEVKQLDTFATAAMLKRAPVQVPMTSSIPGGDERLRKLLVKVTLAPGSNVQPAWAFPAIFSGSDSEVPPGVIRDPKDTRDVFAAYVTSPLNTRFAPVMVNRLWQRYLGFGIVEPVEDWEVARPSHPDLLAYLARELVTHDYDLKHVARLILNSNTYQRAVDAEKSRPLDSTTHLFASPTRRRLSAEQVADTLFAVAGKPFASEELNMDVDGRQPVKTFMNLGTPAHAWEFTSMSNERDRPALAMPRAQAIIDLLGEFGWRESRPNPLNTRPADPTVQQPAMLANGVATRRVVALSDDSAFTQLAVESNSAVAFVDGLFLRILSRKPTDAERQPLVELLAPGFDQRVTDPAARTVKLSTNNNVSWSNHLSAEATTIKLELEKQARLGDPASPRFDADWRQRAEDVIWALINDPEFVFIP